jgi:CDP-diglyceride synthetase
MNDTKFQSTVKGISKKVVGASVVTVVISLFVLAKSEYFFLCLAMIAGFMAYEWASVITNKKHLDIPVLFGFILFLSFYVSNTYVFITLCAAWFLLLVSSVAKIFSAKLGRTPPHKNAVIELILAFKAPDKLRIKNSVIFATGLMYAFFSLNSVGYLHQKLGGIFILLVFLCIWITDTSAFLFGSMFGRTKLAPKISKGKTVEGLILGTLTAVILGTTFSSVLDIFPILEAIKLTTIISLSSHIGDLVESYAKRHFKVKDMGSIIPGHGGFVDRFDSLLMVGLVLRFILR